MVRIKITHKSEKKLGVLSKIRALAQNSALGLHLIILTITSLCISHEAFAQNQAQKFAPFYRAYNNVIENQFRPGSPSYYIVQPGDTYYSVAQRFLSDPRQWASSWEIPPGTMVSQDGYLEPGSIVVLSNTRDAKLRWFPQGEGALAKRYGNYYGIRTGGNSIKLLPVAWGVGNDKPQVLSPNMIDPFKNEAMVVPYTDIANSPIIAGFADNRLLGYTGKEIFVRGHIDESIQDWYVYKPAEELFDPETYVSLGYVSRLQGVVRPLKRSPDAYTFQVISGNAEFERGARLVPANKTFKYQEYNYQRPAPNILARVVGVYDAANITTQFRTIIINRGSEHGVRRGDVFNLLSHTPISYLGEIPMYDVPINGYGRIYVYRVEGRTSFALVLEAEGEVKLYDYVRPDIYDSGKGKANVAQPNYPQQNTNVMRLSPQVYSAPLNNAPYRISQ